MKETTNFINNIKQRTKSASPLTWSEVDENFKFGNSWVTGENYKVGMIVWWNDFLASPPNSDGQMSQWLCKTAHTSGTANQPGKDAKWERLSSVSSGEGLSGTNYVFVSGDGIPSENAAELQAAYNTAKGMSPAIANVITVVVAPGNYTFGATVFTVDTPYINIVSLTGNPDVILDSDENDIDEGLIGIRVTTNNILIKGIKVIGAFFIESNLNNLICENCVGGDNSFGGTTMSSTVTSGTFIRCTGGEHSFGGYGDASGTFTNCTGGDYSFGGNGDASGTFTNCTGGENSFGSNATFSGTATNCTGGDYSFGGSGMFVSSGTATNCTGGHCSFGGGGGVASGVFRSCIGGDGSFGGGLDVGGFANGTFINCTGGDYSFGGKDEGTVAGIFKYCTGGTESFGSSYGGSITSSAKLYYCKLDDGTFPTPVSGGKLVLCIDGIDAIVTTA